MTVFRRGVIINTVDGTRITKEKRSDGTDLVYIYGLDSTPIAFTYNDTYYYYGKNIFGDIVDIYTAGGTKVAHYAYDAWGNHTVTQYNGSTVGNINPFRYRGYYFDTETGFYYLQCRYYDPTTGRFLNADAISYLGSTGGFRSYNLYTYCGNNPVMYTDPTGHEFQWWNPSTWDWETIGIVADIAIGLIAFGLGMYAGFSFGLKAGAFVTAATGKPILGVIAGFVVGACTWAAVTGLINNAVNFIYYTWILDSESDCALIEDPEDTNGYSAYTSGYVTRWDRLKHVKYVFANTKEDKYKNAGYFPYAWMYYSEYNAHMLGWYVLEVTEALGISLLSDYRDNLKKANVDEGIFDTHNILIVIATIACMILGW